MRRIYTETKSLKPWVKVSSSPVGKYNDTKRYPSRGWNAYEVVYQDALQWLKEGIHDALFPMMYFQEIIFIRLPSTGRKIKTDDGLSLG